MKTKSHRRTFLKQGVVLGGGLMLLGSKVQSSRAAESETKPAAGPAAPANETLKTIRSLRTIHGNFLDQPLPESALQTILQASVRAANTSNMQNYSIVVVKDRELMKQVCTYRGSCLLLYCVDYNRMKTLAEHLGYAFFPDNLNCFCLASVDAVLAIQTAAIAARSLGLDYLITNGIHRGDMARLWKLLDLPAQHCFPLIAMVLGYPTAEPAFQKGRLDGPGIIHYEKYHKLTKDETEEMVRQYDDPKRHLALESWNVGQTPHYLDWVFTQWWPAPKPTEQETQILRFLKRSGFVESQKA
ncbi:MAG: nitroreductase family protein [Verrucomicrobiota bacterium]|jgi:nitroreductase